MFNKKFIFLSETVGKTIKGYAYLEYGNNLLFWFGDDTYTIINATNGYDGAEAELINENDDNPYLLDDLVKIGFITQEQKEIFDNERTKKAQEQSRSYRKLQYEQLKKEFGNE